MMNLVLKSNQKHQKCLAFVLFACCIVVVCLVTDAPFWTNKNMQKSKNRFLLSSSTFPFCWSLFACRHTCAMVKSRYIGDKLIPPLNRESLFHGPYKPLRTWVEFRLSPKNMAHVMGVEFRLDPIARTHGFWHLALQLRTNLVTKIEILQVNETTALGSMDESGTDSYSETPEN